MICEPCKEAADGPYAPRHNDCEWPVSCTCQHKSPGAWKGETTSSAPATTTTVTLNLPSSPMSVSQALALIRESRPSQCSVCTRRVALTPKSKRIVRHKREMLCEQTMSDGTVRKMIRHYVCPGSGKPSLRPEKDTVVTATSLLELTDES